MHCPYCQGSTHVTNSRSYNKNQGVWRRRRCNQCHAVWTTTESYDLSTTHRVSYSSQEPPEPFWRDVLFVSIKDSLAHRRTATGDAGALTDTIIRKVLTLKSPVIPDETLKTVAHQTLTAFDSTAGAVYAAKHSL